MAESKPVTFPTEEGEFKSDERISWSKADSKWILEEANGNEWEFDSQLKRWVPTVDEKLLEQQRKAYQVPGVDESEDAQEKHKSKKRKKPDGAQETQANKKKQDDRPNTAVYVTSLPLDATKDEIEDVFSKYGLISEGIENEDKRIKMYTDDEGNFKGEALVVYFRPESVQLAIDMLDDSDFNFREGPNGKMRVQAADMSFKKHKGDNEEQTSKKRSKYDKELADKRKEALRRKLADWGDEDGDEPANDLDDEGDAGNRYEKTVVLKHMFTPQELEEDPEAAEEIQEDVKEEAEKFGEVDKVIVFEMETDGVVTVKFVHQSFAKKCVQAFNGRSFAGRTVEAHIAIPGQRFKKAKKSEDPAEEEARLARFVKLAESGALVKNVDNNGKKNGDE